MRHEIDLSFNSSKVQLELGTNSGLNKNNTTFNSSKVQLERVGFKEKERRR